VAEIFDCSIITLAGGSVIEAADAALIEAAENMLDLNTSPTAKRKVIIEIELAGNQKRNAAVVATKVTTKLAPPEKLETQIFYGREHGKVKLTEMNPDQPTLFQGLADVSSFPTPEASNE